VIGRVKVGVCAQCRGRCSPGSFSSVKGRIAVVVSVGKRIPSHKLTGRSVRGGIGRNRARFAHVVSDHVRNVGETLLPSPLERCWG